MAMYLTPEDHAANPPSSWTVSKASPTRWQLLDNRGSVLDSFPTKKAAEAAKLSGLVFNLYEREGRWFKGHTPTGWKPYAGRPAVAESVS